MQNEQYLSEKLPQLSLQGNHNRQHANMITPKDLPDGTGKAIHAVISRTHCKTSKQMPPQGHATNIAFQRSAKRAMLNEALAGLVLGIGKYRTSGNRWKNRSNSCFAF